MRKDNGLPLPPSSGFCMLDARLAVSGTATSWTNRYLLSFVIHVFLVYPQYFLGDIVLILVVVLDSPTFFVVEDLFQVFRLG